MKEQADFAGSGRESWLGAGEELDAHRTWRWRGTFTTTLGKLPLELIQTCGHLSSQPLRPWEDVAVVGEGNGPHCAAFTVRHWTLASAMRALFPDVSFYPCVERCSVSDSDGCCRESHTRSKCGAGFLFVVFKAGCGPSSGPDCTRGQHTTSPQSPVQVAEKIEFEVSLGNRRGQGCHSVGSSVCFAHPKP